MFDHLEYKWLWVLPPVFVVLDGVITHGAITADLAREANPVMRDVMQETSLLVGIFVSTVLRFVVIGALAALIQYSPYQRYVEAFAVTLFILATGAPVVWNLQVLLL